MRMHHHRSPWLEGGVAVQTSVRAAVGGANASALPSVRSGLPAVLVPLAHLAVPAGIERGVPRVRPRRPDRLQAGLTEGEMEMGSSAQSGAEGAARRGRGLQV